ncbi:MAG TPA: methyltransferase domain-containing protein, partial [bacterium]|nr:methyltransferase domain-containing protein [bacterium]
MRKANYKYNIVLFADGLSFEWNQFEIKALGGSETSALASAKALVKKGHHVTLFCRCEKEGLMPDGVFYRKIGANPGDFRNFLNYCATVPIDVLMLQRIPQMIQMKMNTKLNILWMHDLAWQQQAQTFRGVLHNVDEVWVSNQFAKKQMFDVYGGVEELYHATPQGIIQDYWDREDFQNIPKEKNRIMYCARPERGLDILLFAIMPRLIKRVPDVKLYLAGYGDIPEHLRGLYEACLAQTKKLGDNVVNLGGLSKPDLYKELMKSQAYVYPTAFEETFCLTAVECQRSGTPFITTAGIGALPETLSSAGNIFVDVEGEDEPTKKVHHPDFADKYVDAVVEFLAKPEGEKEARRNVIREFSKEFTWDKATDLWIDRIDEMFEKRTANKYNLARHFYKANDIIAAKKLAEETNDQELLNKININYAYLDTLESARDYYEKQAVDVEGLKRSVVFVEHSPRVVELVKYIEHHSDIKKVLDYGCGEGSLTYPIANIRPDMKVTGCDIARPRLDIAKDMLQRSKYNNVKYKLIDIEVEEFAKKHHEKYDAIVLGEVLEHIENPLSFLDLLEKY